MNFPDICMNFPDICMNFPDICMNLTKQHTEIIKYLRRGKEKREKRKEELPNKWSIPASPQEKATANCKNDH
jgi:hypothetical protein